MNIYEIFLVFIIYLHNNQNDHVVCEFPVPCSWREVKCVFPKIWPNYGQKWNIKEKRFCFFARFELLAKSLWCPEQERFNYFLLCQIVYNRVSCNYLYTQITQQNPTKRQKGGQGITILILHNTRLSYQNLDVLSNPPSQG